MDCPPAPTIRVLVICTTFGQNLAHELGEHAVCKPGKAPHVTKGLLPVAGRALVNHWKSAVLDTPRLLPMEAKMFILCNDENYGDYVSWAGDRESSEGGFPVENIISNGTSGNQRNGMVSDIACFIEKTGGGATDLVIIEGDYLFHPVFNLQRVVEHSLMRGKDMITFLNLADDSNQGQHKIVEFGTAGANPKVACVKPFPPPGESRSLAAVAPLCILRKSTIPKICALAKEMGHFSTTMEDTASFFHWLPTAVPVYALNVGHVFDVKTFDSYNYVNHLFQYYRRKKTGAPTVAVARHEVCHTDFTTMEPGGDLAKRLREAEGRGGEGGRGGGMDDAGVALHQDIPAPKMSDPGALDLEAMLGGFHERYMVLMEEKALDARHDRTLPIRFANSSLRRHVVKAQHPVYTTTNNAYGCKAASQHEMPTKFYGMKEGLTSTFPIVGNKMDMFHDTSFVCGTTKSKVHTTLDDF